jgi:hypothetical protein
VTFSAANPHAAKPYHQSIEFRTPMGEGVVAVSAHSFVRLVEPYCLFAHAGRLRYSPAVVYTRSRGSTADPEKRSSGPGNYRDQADALIDDVAARLK